METAVFQHADPIRLPDILGGPYMIRKPWQSASDEYEAFLDFSEIKQISCKETVTLNELLNSDRKNTEGFPFRCGYISYELLAANFGVCCQAPRDLDLPAAILARPTTRLYIKGKKITVESYTRERVEEILKLARFSQTSSNSNRRGPITPNLSFEQYEQIFHKAREQILEGNTYQIKISVRYSAETQVNPLTAFEKLTKANPSPEAFVLNWGKFALISCSPETVIRKIENKILTRPIGGTFEKKNQSNSQQQINDFLSNEKETSEHNMLIDLERNDLSRICTPGSVKIDQLRVVEPYVHLYHLVSTISGRVKNNVSTPEILKAMLPGGTITGCPKHRTIELIDQLEPCFRGPYTGSFGMFYDNGDLHLNLIIRTLIQTEGFCFIQAGGGIVAESNPQYEYNENRIKALALIELLRQNC
ncbi:MAG: anthranilate synthase component I family protein [Opitutae bacterium]|nr:anthranilate synthase component I family protein [Opitutae bacterium]